MQPLNPFLRAFFRSTLLDQCTPTSQFILLVPPTELLLNSKDRETGIPYTELLALEDFLASHVLRAASAAPLPGFGRDSQQSARDNRAKAKQYTTLNGRTVIVKDSSIYTGKGFKLQCQAQLQSDFIYRPDSVAGAPWVMFKLTKPLIGVVEPIQAPIAVERSTTGDVQLQPVASAALPVSVTTKKKEPKSFAELLILFPMIARQLQGGLDRIVRDMISEIEKPLPAIPSSSSPSASKRPSRRRANSAASSNTLASRLSNTASEGTRYEGWTLDCHLYDEEEGIRQAVETAVTASIDHFQLVDKHQLALLGTTTDLTGTQVEQFLEQYVVQHVHDKLLFPRLSERRQAEDASLDSQVRHMVDVDLTQVGLPQYRSQAERQEFARRITKGVEVFKKITAAQSALEMIQVLLSTQKVLSDSTFSETPNAQQNEMSPKQSEKQDPLITSNADTLVSLLLIVVIRSSVRHLRARFVYMRYFIFTDDSELGELGYALSTFEAVLTYLTNDAIGLRRASKRNARLWGAIRSGDLADLKAVLAASVDGNSGDFEFLQLDGSADQDQQLEDQRLSTGSDGDGAEQRGRDGSPDYGSSSLSHIFPFQRPPTPPPDEKPKTKKRVSLATRSLSSSGLSMTSVGSIDAFTSPAADDFSLDTLLRSRGPSGESILMMAIDAGRVDVVRYLLSLKQFFGLEELLSDQNNNGVTLLSAAVQSGVSGTTELLLHAIQLEELSAETFDRYLAETDVAGRCVAHYLFNLPQVMYRIGRQVSWTQKDNHGQTPLFALCRSYDHRDYRRMVELGLSEALKQQQDTGPLHLQAHVDAKGNTLLHIATDSKVVSRLLHGCDANINAKNDKAFTPLMVASKFGRMDIVKVLLADPRIDIYTRDARGFTATELAKDDEVRNRMDDLVLLLDLPDSETRITSIVRSIFVEDGTVRLIIKCAERNSDGSITVTTCRRGVDDFLTLGRILALEMPASWLPDLASTLLPIPFPVRSSKAVMRDWQIRLDVFMKTLLSHPSFKNHEAVWEFILVPDIDLAMLAERSKRKAESRAEMIRDEYAPVEDVREIELFVSHAKDSVRGFHHAVRSVLRRTNAIRQGTSDMLEAAEMTNTNLQELEFLPRDSLVGFSAYVASYAQSEFPPFTEFWYTMTSVSSTIAALLKSLNRPTALVDSISAAKRLRDRHFSSLRRNDRWPLGLLDETRKSLHKDAYERVAKSDREIENLGRELRYTQQVVAVELADWQEERVKLGRKAIKQLAKRCLVAERERLVALRGALRIVGGTERDRTVDRGKVMSGQLTLPLLSVDRVTSTPRNAVENGDEA